MGEPRQISVWWGLPFGLLAGLLNGALNEGGPPVVICAPARPPAPPRPALHALSALRGAGGWVFVSVFALRRWDKDRVKVGVTVNVTITPPCILHQ